MESVKSPGQYLHVSKGLFGKLSVYSQRYVITERDHVYVGSVTDTLLIIKPIISTICEMFFVKTFCPEALLCIKKNYYSSISCTEEGHYYGPSLLRSSLLRSSLLRSLTITVPHYYGPSLLRSSLLRSSLLRSLTITVPHYYGPSLLRSLTITVPHGTGQQ